MTKPIDRRAFICGAGFTLALPLLDCMAAAPQALPRRACFMYFSNGVSLPPKDHPSHQDWHWFPHGTGRDFTFTKTLAALEPFRADISILQGLSHPLGRRMVGHSVGDIYLTGADIHNVYKNTISIDQVIAREFASQTRYPSLSLASDGGIGYAARTGTISFNPAGQPIPAEADPRRIFNRLFGSVPGQTIDQQRAGLRNRGSMLDFMLEDTRSLQRRVGQGDKAKLDEYLTSVREVEKQVERTSAWLEIVKPKVDERELNLAALPADPAEYIKTVYDLIFLAFRTDSTRVAAYQITREGGGVFSDAYPTVLGLPGHHSLSHSVKKGDEKGYENWARYDAFLAAQFAHFLQRLKSTPEGSGTLLDRTTVLYGCSTSTTHNARNYPIIIAGGAANGLKHGALHRYTENTPFSNALLRIAQATGVRCEKFADSTGALAEI